MKSTLLFTAVAVALVSSAASATTVNITGPYTPPGESLGLVTVGQHGTINAGFKPYSLVATIPVSPPVYNIQGVITGSIPAMSKITFTYTYSNASQVYLDGFGSYGYTTGGNTYQGQADTNTGYQPGGTGPSHLYTATTSIGGGTPIPSLPLVWSTANITTPVGGAGTGTTSIQNNNTANSANFTTTFMAFVSNFVASGGTLSYNVSAIPLPPALPLFAAIIAGMFGYARFGRRKALAA